MIIQSTLVTSHKGVDLHAETAGRVMMRDLEGGDRLVRLARADFHTFWHESGNEAPESIARLLGVGRFFNPNKHHYAHFVLQNAGADWFAAPPRGSAPTAGWPGERMSVESARGRLYVAIYTLRRMGFDDVMERVDDGYRLHPDLKVSHA